MPERHRILIIDDNALDRQAVVHALSREVIEHDGIEADVQEAETIAQAREALRREEFTCIFLDASLPDGAPTDLLMEVRSQGLSTPVIVLTGQRDEQAILEVMKAGAIDYLPKDRLQPELVAQSLRAALRFQEAQREKQAALSELRARDRAIAAATNGIAISDPRQHDCPLVYVNEAFLRMTGYTEAEVLGRNCRFLQGSGTDRNTVRELHEALQEARPCQVLLYNYRKDGVGFWNELTVSPVQDAQGTLTHFVGIQTDVTVRHEEEQERIRTSDTLRQFQFLSDNSNDAFFLIDNSGHFVYVNDAACRSLGHSAEEFAQMRPFDIDPNYDDAAYQALFQLTGGQRLAPFESQQRRKDGTVFPIEASVSRVDIGGRSLLFSSCRDITARKAVEQALQKASERTTGILESITDAFFALDVEFRFTYVNSQAEHLLLRTREELLGQHLLDAFPEASGSTFDFQYQRAFTEQIAVSFEEFFPPLDTWFEVRAYPSESGLSIFFQDVNERRQAQEALRISEQALRESNRQARDAQLRLESALSAGGIATWTWDLVTDLMVVDANFARLFSVSDEYAKGGPSAAYFAAIHPEDQPLVAKALEDAFLDRDVYEVEYRVIVPDGTYRWLSARGKVERDAKGKAIALPGAVLDITEHMERMRQDHFLAELADRARTLTNPDAVIADTVRSLVEYFAASRCVFADIDIEADVCTIPVDFCVDATIVSMAGSFPISVFGPYLVDAYRNGRTVVVEDVKDDPVRFPLENVGAYDAVAVRAFIAVPVLHSSRLVSVIALHSVTPRRWKPEEVALLQSVVERTWLTVEVLRQQRALAHEAEALRTAHQRRARVLESITDAFFALDHDWKFIYVNHEAEKMWARSRQQLLGKNLWEEFPEAIGSVFDEHFHVAVEEQASISFEAFYAPLETWLEIRLYPSSDGLSVFFQNVNERRALEAARAQIIEREHRIAAELQAALQPELPAVVPGLAVTKYYEAALTDEAGVGGDFYDVFAVEKNCYALVVGDLSGKGLAAAAQVSIVRNMLRAFLYSKPAVTEAVTELNRVLAENNLLTGFSTLFVSVYDADTCCLRYVNCGQEPALLRRAATSTVEQLMPTGAILGSIENAQYTEELVTLAPGDALAIFTDGVTEVGSTRLKMLGIEGAIALLEQPLETDEDQDAEEIAEQLMLHMIAGVDAAAEGGVMRDDVCLLVAVAHSG